MMKKFRIDVKEGKGNKDFIRGKVTGIMDLILGIRKTSDGRNIYDYLWYSNSKNTDQKFMLCKTTDEKFEKVKEGLIKARLYPNIVEITEVKKN